jgi:hypothetical protein
MKLVKKLVVLTMMTALIIVLFGLKQQNNRDEIMLYTQQPQQRQLRSKFDSRYADPKTVTIKKQSQQQTQQQQQQTQKIINLDTIFSIDNHNIINDNKYQPTFDPVSYAYLIIHYHKTGHHLSRQLRDFLVAGTTNDSSSNKPPIISDNGRENAFQHRYHEQETGCPHAMVLYPGIVAVQAAPDFFCTVSTLVEYLLRDDNGGIDDNDSMLQQQQQQTKTKKCGIKIIHLVRNPYSLAVSNWVYHAQYPTPEQWVKKVHPCIEERWYDTQSYRDLVQSTLLVGKNPIMKYTDFDDLRDICTSLYQTGNASKESKKPWTYYTHLRHLDPQDALSMATSHMLIQGITGGDIVRMANNVVKLNQVMKLEDQIRLSPSHENNKYDKSRMIQVMTMSMEEFIQEPHVATMRFLDFALEESTSFSVKEQIAIEYAKAYNDKIKKGDKHITNDKSITNGGDINIAEKKEEMIDFLRQHRLFGRVLGNIERLIDETIEKSSSSATTSRS